MTVPKGWKLVPEIPTAEMMDAALADYDMYDRSFKERIYMEMLAAAPGAPLAVVPLVDEIYDNLGPIALSRTSRENVVDVLHALISTELRAAPQDGSLTVWYGSMPESNGKHNYSAILHRGDISQGITIERSEYPERVRYEADRVRWLIGEIDQKPWILDYDADKHSGYQGSPTDLNGAIQRVAKFVSVWQTRRGLDPKVIHGLDSDKELLVDDLIQLVRAARIAQGD
jgi:hypothetical protein